MNKEVQQNNKNKFIISGCIGVILLIVIIVIGIRLIAGKKEELEKDGE